MNRLPLTAAAGLLLMLTGCTGYQAELYEEPVERAPLAADRTEPPAPSLPVGFTDAGNGLAYDFVEPDCSYLKCVTAELFAYEDCAGGVYIEANVRDRNDVVIGYTNDSLSQLLAGQTGRVELTIIEDSGIGVTLTELNCR